MRKQHISFGYQGAVVTIALSLMIGIPAAFAADGSANLQKGSDIFHQTCIACHGENGKGAVPGAPNLTKPKGVLSLDEDLLVSRVEHGYQGNGSPMAMPPKGGNPTLTTDDIRDVLAYMRKTYRRD